MKDRIICTSGQLVALMLFCVIIGIVGTLILVTYPEKLELEQAKENLVCGVDCKNLEERQIDYACKGMTTITPEGWLCKPIIEETNSPAVETVEEYHKRVRLPEISCLEDLVYDHSVFTCHISSTDEVKKILIAEIEKQDRKLESRVIWTRIENEANPFPPCTGEQLLNHTCPREKLCQYKNYEQECGFEQGHWECTELDTDYNYLKVCKKEIWVRS